MLRGLRHSRIAVSLDILLSPHFIYFCFLVNFLYMFVCISRYSYSAPWNISLLSRSLEVTTALSSVDVFSDHLLRTRDIPPLTHFHLFISGCTGSSLGPSGFLQLQCAGFLTPRLLLLQSTGSRPVGFGSCSMWAQQLWCMGLVALWDVEYFGRQAEKSIYF